MRIRGIWRQASHHTGLNPIHNIHRQPEHPIGNDSVAAWTYLSLRATVYHAPVLLAAPRAAAYAETVVLLFAVPASPRAKQLYSDDSEKQYSVVPQKSAVLQPGFFGPASPNPVVQVPQERFGVASYTSGLEV
jgi:hypothetical protein